MIITHNITSVAELKKAIRILEEEQAINGSILREDFGFLLQSLKPINLLKSTFRDVAESPHLIESIMGSVLGMATGYLSKKLVIGGSNSFYRKIIGSILQFGVSNAISRHPEKIKSVGQYIASHFFRRKETYSN